MVDRKIGKIDLETFTTFVLPRLGKSDDTVVVPPKTGVDAGVIDIGNDQVLIIAEDPIFAIPQQPLDDVWMVHRSYRGERYSGHGRQAEIHDVFTFDAPRDEGSGLSYLVDAIHSAALELEIAIVGGHTGMYPGFAAPTIGGVTVFAIADKHGYVTPAGATPGDDVILTKGPAIETAGILAVIKENELLKRHPPALVERAKALCRQMTVVADALLAMDAGGVTAMHDATEGGVVGGLYEIANASGVGMEIDEGAFIYPDEVRIVCETFGIDPVTTNS